MQLIKLNCVLVVEGKTDTNFLKQFFDVETIETNGSALTKSCIELIKKTALHQEVILVLDPDYQGKKITAKILEQIPELKICEFTYKDLAQKAKKVGVAELNSEILIKKIQKVCQSKTTKTTPNWDFNDYLELNYLKTKQGRLNFCNFLNIPYFNHKQMFKKLHLIYPNYQELLKAIQKCQEIITN